MWKMNQYLPLFLIAFCLFFTSHSQTTSNTSSQHRCLPDQSSALLQLRKEFVEERIYSYEYEPSDYYNGSYPKMKSWKADGDCCSTWDGVTCDAHYGHVIGLDLSKSWLCGPLNSNSSLFRLRHLRKLNLALNNFSSSTTIPSEFGQLVRLTHLNLSRSFLHGRIPSEISWLSNLVSLDLSFNYFDYFDAAGYHYKFLKVRRNDLEAFVQNVTYLRELHLDDVNISSSLPQSLANLSSLTSLSLQYCNLLGEFPSNIFLLPKIQAIDVSGNYILTGFLPNFQSGSSLKQLRLSYTNFSGELLDAIGNLKSLNFLDLSQTYFFRELPNSIGNLESLSHLDLSWANFLGELPKSICNLKSLSYLDLFGTNFLGELPNSIGNLKSLSHLDLGSTNFSGKLPDSIGNLNSLNYLDLGYSKFSGEIPPSIGNLSQLTYLTLFGSNFQGQLPSTLGNLAKLTSLDLHNSLFSGQLPSTLGNLAKLTSLDLSYNLFSGHNQIQGKIPRSLVQCQRLEVLNLGNNNISEAFPFWLQSLPELRILVLRANGFHGPIWAPHTGFGFSELHVIDLSHNNFSSSLPSEYFRTWNAMQMVPAKDKSQPEYMGSQSNYYEDSMTVVNKGLEIFLVKILTIFTAIDLSNNRFDGEIPNSVGNLKGLIVLNLSSNSFMDRVPSSLGNLTALESLDLSQNELSGKIPQQLISLTFLEYLNLSQNQLVGPIPQGGQFWTFENSSFEGNSGLCGSPLSKKCGNNETPTCETSQESSIVEGFDWKVVVIGYACGLIIGLVIGYFTTSRRTVWFVRNFGVHLRS
ncbi:hypothetical protein ACB094_03G038500 [Castanea mollissima]